jgi:hypothetical protein
MDKSTTPFGESVKRQSVTKKIFELAKASPTDFFINILPLFTLSKIKTIRWGSNKLIFGIEGERNERDR